MTKMLINSSFDLRENVDLNVDEADESRVRISKEMI